MKTNSQLLLMLGLVVHFLPSATGVQRRQFTIKRCDADLPCVEPHTKCDLIVEQCVCERFYYLNSQVDECMRCPSEGEVCTDCCADDSLSCFRGRCRKCFNKYGNNICGTSQSLFFITASQIILSAALIMGIAALVTLLFKICTKPNYLEHRRLMTNSNETLPRRCSRASLTSIQVRVLTQMRDRPPRYESRHNYCENLRNQIIAPANDYRSQQSTPIAPPSLSLAMLDGTETENVRTRGIAAASTAAAAAVEAGQPPPSYDGVRDSIDDLPPPYSIADANGGTINEAFLVDEDKMHSMANGARAVHM